MPSSLFLTTSQLIAAVRELDGEELNARTLASWAQTGIATPSIAWHRIRGRHHPRVYNLTDLARVRLVARMRKQGISMPKVRAILAYLEQTLKEVLKPKTQAVLIVEGWHGTIIRGPESFDVEIPSGQLRLPLADVVKGNLQAARDALKAA